LGLTILLLASAWGFTLFRLQQEQDLVVRHAETSQQNLSPIVAENLRQILERGTLYALVADHWFQSGPEAARANLAALLTSDRAYVRISLFDTEGHLLFASSPSANAAPPGGGGP
jgi:hypothetical protein